MTASIVSFDWEAGGSKQVLYIGSDHEVHELSVVAGGSWQHANISQRARTSARIADNFATHLIGFAWEDNRSKQVFFVDNLNHVHELFVQAGGDWNHADLTTLIPLYLMYPGIGYAWKAGRSKHLVHPTMGAILEAHVEIGGRWGTRNLTVEARVPVAARTYSGLGSLVGGASFAGYDWQTANSQQVAYIGIDNHIHELYTGADGIWHYADLTARARARGMSAPDASSLERNSFIAGYGWEEGHTKQVLYFDDTGAINELYCRVGEDWNWANLTDLSRAPRVSSSRYNRMVGYGWREGGTKQVVYIGDDRHVHELVCGLNSNWTSADLTNLSGGAPLAHPTDNLIAACGWHEGRTKQVVYVDANRHVVELYCGLDGVWRFADLTARTSSPAVG